MSPFVSYALRGFNMLMFFLQNTVVHFRDVLESPASKRLSALQTYYEQLAYGTQKRFPLDGHVVNKAGQLIVEVPY